MYWQKPRHTTFWWVGTDIAHKSSSTINKLYEGVHVCLTSITSHRSCGAVVHDAKGWLWKDQTVNTVPPFWSVVSPIFFLLKIITLPLTSEGPGSANGVITVAKGMLEACSKSLLHGILYIVLLMKRGLQFPEKKKKHNELLNAVEI